MKTEILVSIGPACETEEVLRDIIKAGMTIARVNFSHAPHDEAKMRFDNIRKIMSETGAEVKIMQDLCGPRIRIGEVEVNGEKGRNVEAGESVTFYTIGAPEPTETEILIKDPYLHNDVKVGGKLLIDSGKFTTHIVSVDKDRQRITVTFDNGGLLLSNKGVNVPNVKLTTASPTEKDKVDIVFGLEENVDYVAVSFAQTADDLNNVRALLTPHQKVWAKVEDPIGVRNIDEIIAAADGIIVARGDLGVEVPLEDVPFIQKMMVKKCNDAGKPVIVATQMLASMVSHPTPTRAEVSDVVNAILDGGDGIWVSEESTIGDYPVQVVQTMSRIAARTEELLDEKSKQKDFMTDPEVALKH